MAPYLGFTADFPLFLDQDPTLWRSLEGLTPIKILVDKHRRPVFAETGGSPSNAFGWRVPEVRDRR